MTTYLKRKRQNYVRPLFDDYGHPIPQEYWEYMLPEVKAIRPLRKRKHNSPDLQDIDPDFGEVCPINGPIIFIVFIHDM